MYVLEQGGHWMEIGVEWTPQHLCEVLAEAQWEGEAASQLTSSDVDLVALLATLGLLGGDIGPVSGDVALVTGPGGELVGLTLDVAVAGSVIGEAGSADVDLVYDFETDTEGQPIEKPDDLWVAHQSEANGYTWELPDEWQFSAATSQQPWDTYRNRDRDRILVQVFEIPAGTRSKAALNAFVAQTLADYPVSDTGLRVELEGVAARYLVGWFEPSYDKVFYQVMLLATGRHIYQVQMMCLAGDEEADTQVFGDLFGEFTPTLE
jgi:hypothetical protein